MRISTEEQMKPLWDLNEKYPEYISCVQFDHVNPPFHNIDEVKKVFKSKLDSAIKLAIDDITDQIQIAEESSSKSSKAAFINFRKQARELKNLSLDDCNTIEELESKVPEFIKDYWGK